MDVKENGMSMDWKSKWGLRTASGVIRISELKD